jgi:hypothetical protein
LNIVDTGYGLERVAWCTQGAKTVYDSVFPETIKWLKDHAKNNTDMTSIYSLADHTKCLAFMLGDGIVPSNVKAGYLARLIIRRSLRFLEKIKLDVPLPPDWPRQVNDEELKMIRCLLGDEIPLLIPGIGAQGADVEKTIKNGTNKKGTNARVQEDGAFVPYFIQSKWEELCVNVDHQGIFGLIFLSLSVIGRYCHLSVARCQV